MPAFSHRPRCSSFALSISMSVLVVGLFVPGVHAAPLIRGLGGPAGFGTGNLPPNDDGSSPAIDVSAAFPDGLRFFGMVFREVYVNNNGNITFGGPLPTYTPAPFPVASLRMIAPWWGDVDTRGGGLPARNGVWWDIRPGQFTVTWHNVGYYAIHDDLQNSFQLILRASPECGVGDFDVEFRYERCEWTTGDASGGRGGFGGTPAQAGFDAGDRMNYYTLPGSRTMDVLNLCNTSNVGEPGVWRFQIRGGELPCMGSGAPCTTSGLGVCRPGTIQCRGGMPTCVPESAPSPERCDGLDNDCDGMTDEDPMLCPAGYTCDRAQCVPICVEGGCFEGQVCSPRGTCVEISCRDVTCPEGQRCEGGRCLQACEGISCPVPTVCRAGRCVDPCEGVTCDRGNVCVDGRCVLHCACRPCPPGQVCGRDGRCVPAPCAMVTCDPGLVCQAGRCVDPCDDARCPRGQVCENGRCVTPTDAGTDGGSLPDATEPPYPDSGATTDAANNEDAGQQPATDGAPSEAGEDAGSGFRRIDTRAGCACRTAGIPSRSVLPMLLTAGAILALATRRRSKVR